MSLTICVVVYNEEKNLSIIENNLALLNRIAPHIRCLLVDNASSDGSRRAVQELSEKYCTGHLLRQQNSLPQARQQALMASETQWVGFVDADCRIDECWVRSVEEGLATSGENVAGFGGPWTVGGEGQALYKSLFRTFLGHFGNCYLAGSSISLLVEHLPTANVIYRREKVLSVGGFSSPHPHVGEDLDLSQRLRTRGFLLELRPNVKIEHQLPVDLKKWCYKMFLYGIARAEVSLRYNIFASYKMLLPISFLPTFIISFVVSKTLFWCLSALYFAACIVCSLDRQEMSLWGAVFLRMVATHVFYALGVYYGYSIQLPLFLRRTLGQWRYKVPAMEDTSV